MKIITLVVVATMFTIFPIMLFITNNQLQSPSSCGTTPEPGSYNAEQIENATTIINVGETLEIGPDGQAIAIATALVESELFNVNYGDEAGPDSRGLFQQGFTQGWGTAAQIMDPTYSSTKFYEALQQVDGWETLEPGDAAQTVQRSAFPDKYARRMKEATQLVTQIAGTAPTNATCGPGEATGTQTDIDTHMGGTITVDESLAPSAQQLLDDAAVDGIILGGWGYRPNSRQIELRIKHCGGNTQYAIYEKPSGSCSPPTARPGHSQHELGLAIDFTCNGRSMAGTACFQWLKNNAAQYGLTNLASEPWHWSTTGK